MNRFFGYAVLYMVLALILGCARLPEYARPHMDQAEDLQQTRAAGFPYRELTIDDFRATSLSEQIPEHAEQINAHVATQIRLTADSNFRITRGELYGQRYFIGSIERLAFEAVMLPDRSWWNPKIPANMRGYVLQHEQIHFALTELAARQLTRDSHQMGIGGFGDKADAARGASGIGATDQG